jgi:RND family efflux transporter MFP subunit
MLTRASDCGLLAACLLAITSGCGRENTYAPPPPPKVTVAQPLRHPVTTYREFTGRTAAYEQVELRARVPGFLAAQHYEDGRVVKAGTPMFTIEQAPYRAALLAAQARLAEANAELHRREFDYKKVQGLRADQVASEQELVIARAAFESGQAAVQAADAAVRQAELDLSYTTINAPIGGHTNRALAEVGDLVGQGSPTVLATIVRWHPMYVYFTASERDVLEFRRIRAAEGGGPLKPLTTYFRLADGTDYPIAGVLDYADNQVDPATGTVEARAVVDNPQELLVPGIFCRVRIPRATKSELLVPQVALQRDLAGYFLLVVDAQNDVGRADVKVGEQVDTLRVIAEGLTGDERVVIKGLQRARPGIEVQPTETTITAPETLTTQPVETAPTTAPGV